MAQNHNDGHNHDHHGGGHHIVPLPVYFKTLAALLVLTVLTVGASYVDVGHLNIYVSLGIATAKATLVMMFFMGLKYDNNLNRAVILSSFVAIFLLISISASDLWTRKQANPVKVKSAAAALSTEDLNKLMVSSPELVAQGKQLFNTNCAVCHGSEGKGDGAGGAALNPKPRNFHAGLGEWKNGTSAKAMYVTLAYGIPNSGMASYKALPPADRLALIHYVHTMTPQVEQSSKGDSQFAAAVKEDGIGGAGGGPKATLPIDFAIERLIKN